LPEHLGPVLLFEAEAAGAQVGRKVLSFGHCGLARLVLRPAVKRSIPENLRRTLLPLWDRVPRVAPDVVGVDGLAEMSVVVAVGVQYDLERQAHADVAGGSGIADA